MANPESRRITRTMSATQLVALLLAFVLAAGAGGVLTAGLVIPLVASANAAADSTVQLFDEVPDELEPGPLSQQSRIYAANGKLLGTFYAQNRILVPIEKVSQPMQDAVVAIEDERFWEHGGVDMRGITRALANNLGQNNTQGASTITQQYVKNVLIEQALVDDDPFGVLDAKEDSISRKLREAKLAIALEKKMDKREILQGYLNVAQFGSKSVYGVETAARYYFSKSAKDLTVVEAATIAGVTKAPGTFDPTVNPEKAEERRNAVLANMWKLGYIDRTEWDEAKATPIEDTLHVRPVKIGCQAAGNAAFFCDYVIKEIMSSPAFGETRDDRRQLLYRGGLKIKTTLDPKMQRAAYQSISKAVPVDDSSGLEAAIVSVEPGTGEIKAMAQNVPYKSPQDDEGARTTSVNYSAGPAYGASRGFQVGSNFKPVVLAEWLRSGHTLNDFVSGNKVTYNVSNFQTPCLESGLANEEWKPANSEGVQFGPMSVLKATYLSINTAYAAMGSQLNLCELRDTAWDMGFRPTNSGVQRKVIPNPEKSDIDIQAPMVVGTQESSPLSMAAMYATLASGGTYCEPIAITKVTGPGGTEYEVPSANCDKNALPSNVANTVVSAMKNVLTIGTAAGQGLDGGRPAAGKTGTAQLSWHTWFTGFTRQLSTSVWVGDEEGNVDHTKGIVVNGQYHDPLYGSDVAAPAWQQFMNAASEGMPIRDFGAADPALIGRAPAPPASNEPKDDGDNGGGDNGGGDNGGGGGRGDGGGPATLKPPSGGDGDGKGGDN